MSHWASHLPCQRCLHSLYFTSHCGLPQFHAVPHRPQPLERDQYFKRMGPVKLHLNKDPTLVGDPKSPPCCIHLKGSAVMIQTIWGAEWICRDPVKRQATHGHSFTAPFFCLSSPPRSSSIPSVPWGSSLKKVTSLIKTQILQHMLPPPPSTPTDPPTIKRKRWQTDGQTHITLTLVHTSQCQGWMSAGEETSCADVLIKRGDNTD